VDLILKSILKRLRASAFIQNTISAISGQGLNVLVQGIYFVLLARALGPKEYGAYIAILAFSRIFLAFSNWGYGSILIKNASRNPETFRDYWGTALSVTVLGGAFFVMVVLAASRIFLHLDIPIAAMVLISVSALVLAQVQSLAQQAYQSFDRLGRFVQLQNGASIFRLGAVVLMLFLARAPTVLLWSWLYFLTGLAPAVASIALVNREIGHYRLGLKLTRPEVVEGFYFSVASASYTIDNDIDKTLLASLGGLEAAGLYTAAYRFVDFAFTPITGLLTSSYANYFKHGMAGVKGSRRWALKLLPWAAVYGVLAAIALFFLASALPLVLGPNFGKTSEMLRWLSPLITLKSVEFLIADVLTGAGHQGMRTVVQAGVAAVNVTLCLWLIPRFGWFGAALGSLASDAIAVIGFSVAVIVAGRKPGVG
jgi:O-antigen/teichoic acid export membrane protein